MKMDRALLVLFVAALLTGSCAQPPPALPHSLAEYETMRTASRQSYPRETILLKNLQRVLDGEQPTGQRVASLQLVLHLGARDPSVRHRLSAILTQQDSPYELHHTVLSFLLANDYPGLAAYVVPALARADQDPQLRDAILQWLMRHPSPEVLSEIVNLWANEPSPVSVNEPRFRYIIEQISGTDWQEALLAGINSSESFERGRALEILARRLPVEWIKRRIMELQPKSQPMAALQSFMETFDYLPVRRTEFAAVATVFGMRLEMISDAARLQTEWRHNYGYRFNIRDFHLLSRLARDPLRTMLRRTQLILELGQALATRQHVRYSARRKGRGRAFTDRFGLQIESLSNSDLWNLYLLNEMLNRPRVQLALKVMADRNRAGTDESRSGLLFYEHGQPEAMLYPPELTSRMTRDGRDALCYFRTHFQKVYNTAQAGPSAEELQEATQSNHYGLILTSVNEYAFCAHYYNPRGLVVSLGKFPFRH